MDYIPLLAHEPTLAENIISVLQYPLNVFYHPLETLVSPPALSFLLIPAFSSYSTTLNFLFFYMTWALLIHSNPPLKVELYGTLAVRVLFFLIPSFVFLLFDAIVPGLAARMKEHGNGALAIFKKSTSRSNTWWKVVIFSIFNVVTGVVLQTSIDFFFTHVLQVRSAIRVVTVLPMPWVILKDLMIGLLLREASTYALHRHFLHQQDSRLARLHAEWQHSVGPPYSFVAHYDHPLAYFVHVFVPTYLPATLMRMHLLTFHMYLTIVSLEETFAFSGYNILPTAFILGGIARRQERHLLGAGDGNFGCFGLADFLMATNLGDDVIEDVLEEVDGTQVVRRTKGKAKAIESDLRRKVTSHSQSQRSSSSSEETDSLGNDMENSPEAPRRRPTRQSTKDRRRL